jgi:membrane protease YdiL (CAAX protease family)
MTCAALLVAFGAAVRLRVAVGGAAVAVSPVAGLCFAGVLGVLTALTGVRTRLSWRAVAWGTAGAAVLCAPPLVRLVGGGHWHGDAPPLSWVVVVGLVAVAEEAFLRGALYQAAEASMPGGAGAAVLTSLCFAALHVPLYGWHSAPLDAAVGLWLAALRRLSGTWTAPAVCHVLADLAGWWLR